MTRPTDTDRIIEAVDRATEAVASLTIAITALVLATKSSGSAPAPEDPPPRRPSATQDDDLVTSRIRRAGFRWPSNPFDGPPNLTCHVCRQQVPGLWKLQAPRTCPKCGAHPENIYA